MVKAKQDPNKHWNRKDISDDGEYHDEQEQREIENGRALRRENEADIRYEEEMELPRINHDSDNNEDDYI